jgi:hypothetical protein
MFGHQITKVRLSLQTTLYVFRTDVFACVQEAMRPGNYKRATAALLDPIEEREYLNPRNPAFRQPRHIEMPNVVRNRPPNCIGQGEHQLGPIHHGENRTSIDKLGDGVTQFRGHQVTKRIRLFDSFDKF